MTLQTFEEDSSLSELNLRWVVIRYRITASSGVIDNPRLCELGSSRTENTNDAQEQIL